MLASIRILGVYLCLSICLSGVALAQTLDKPLEISIPAGNLADALEKLGNQAGVQIMYEPEVAKGIRVDAISGTLTTHQALTQLLAQTGLKADRVNDKTVVLRKAEVEKKPQPVKADKDQSSTANRPSAEPFEDLQEIVVTAQKREERLQDVPISIIAMNADELDKRNLTSIDDLALAVPGLAVQNNGTVRRIAVRGVANVFGTASLTGIYLDEADVTSTGSTQLALDTYDLQRVEVLRGPQGTLYGEGSVGGTVRFITNKPVLDLFQLSTDVAALFTEDGAPSQRIREAINIPLLEDTLGIRIAGQFDHEGGWIAQPAANQTDINDQNIVDMRAQVLWKPIEALSVHGTVEIHRDQGGQSTGEDATGNYTQVFNLATTPRIADRFDLYNLTAAYDFGWAKLLDAATYFKQANDIYNRGTLFQITAPPAAPFNEYLPLSTQDESSRSDELRLTSTGSGRWQWTVGTFYRDFRNDASIPLYNFGLAGPPGSPLPPPFGPYYVANQSKAWSVFADTSYKIADRLTIGAGLRRYSDHETNPVTMQTATFRSVDPRFYADLKLTQQVNVYGSAAKGFRSGGFNVTSTDPSYNPENVWTYELGTKTSWLENRLRINAAVFYSKYSSYIVVGVSPSNFLGTLTQNAGDAVIKGVEWDLAWRLMGQWTVSLSGDYLKTYFTTVSLTPDSAPVAVGDNLDFTPKYQETASVQRDFVWADKTGFARLDYSLQGRDTYRNRSVAGPSPWYFSESDVIHMLSFNAGVQWNESLSLGFFAQNLLNDRGFTSPIVIEQQAERARPRTYGVDFTVKF